jgi:hypothetical protein
VIWPAGSNSVTSASLANQDLPVDRSTLRDLIAGHVHSTNLGPGVLCAKREICI